MLYKVNSKKVDLPIGSIVEPVKETESTITLQIDMSNPGEPNKVYGLRTYPREYFVVSGIYDETQDMIDESLSRIVWVEDVEMVVTEVVEDA